LALVRFLRALDLEPSWVYFIGIWGNLGKVPLIPAGIGVKGLFIGLRGLIPRLGPN